MADQTHEKSLRVLHVVEAFGGGVYEMLRLLAAGQLARGHSVAIAYGVRPETPPDVERTLHPDIQLFLMPWTHRSLGAQVQAFSALRELERNWRPDVVHLHSSFAGAVGATALAGCCLTVYTPHGYAFDVPSRRGQHHLIRAAERRVAARVTAIGAVSNCEADLAHGLGTARRVVTVPNGIPEFDALQERLPRLDRSARVVAMGRIMPQRQPEATAAILGAVRDVAEVEWIGGGRADDPAPMRALGRAGVRATGWLSRDAALERLDDAVAYLHWTAWDGHPLSILEAIARDVVVAASAIPANREILGDTQTFSDAGAAERFIRRVLSDDDFRVKVLLAQHLRARSFGANTMIENWLDVYRTLPAPLGSRPEWVPAPA